MNNIFTPMAFMGLEIYYVKVTNNKVKYTTLLEALF